MALKNENIAGLGYRLQVTDDVRRVEPLLSACKLVRYEPGPGARKTSYLLACTRAGGVAAAVGWSLYGANCAILHSLAVAPSSRGSGVGASQLASAMLHLREDLGVKALFLRAAGAVGFFSGFGFVEYHPQELPEGLADHAQLRDGAGTLMARCYDRARPGLDHSAFCLIHNSTPDATLPVGSVFWFRQAGPVLEAHYRGGSVLRGHLLGARDGKELNFVWQQCTEKGKLMSGRGEIVLKVLADGRRELREKLGDNPGELLLREL